MGYLIKLAIKFSDALFELGLTRLFILAGLVTLAIFIPVQSLGNVKDYFKPELSRKIVQSDLLAYITAAKVIQLYGVDKLYNLEIQREVQEDISESMGYDMQLGVLSFRSIPVASFLYYPTVLLEPLTVYRINLILIFICLLVSLYILRNIYSLDLLSTFIVLALPITTGILHFVQISSILLVATLAAIYAIQKNKFFLAGLLLSLLLIKIQLVLLAFFLMAIYIKKPTFIAGFTTGSLGLVGLSILTYGTSFIPDYLQYLFLTESSSYGTNLIFNYNLLGLSEWVRILFKFDMGLTGILALITTLLILVSGLTILASKIRKDILVSLAMFWGLFLNFHTMLVDLAFLSIPLATMLTYYKKFPKKIYVFFSAIIFAFIISIVMGRAQGIFGLFLTLYTIFCLIYLIIDSEKEKSTQSFPELMETSSQNELPA